MSNATAKLTRNNLGFNATILGLQYVARAIASAGNQLHCMLRSRATGLPLAILDKLKMKTPMIIAEK